jgi:D-3-phosphoglycerate dehydrogenase
VNALHLAESRGIELRRSRLGPHADYREYLELRVAHRAGEQVVAGALLAETHPRIVRIGEYPVAVLPSGTLVLLRNRDVPGVIGRVGTLLGGVGVNIAEYYQSRLREGGEALAALRVDGRVPQEVVDALRRLRDILDVTQVDLG